MIPSDNPTSLEDALFIIEQLKEELGIAHELVSELLQQIVETEERYEQ